MVSDTKKSWNRRDAKTAKLGRKHKKVRTKAGTPKFPVHPDGKPAATAKPATKAKPAAKPKA
jgi:hypothetical protein